MFLAQRIGEKGNKAKRIEPSGFSKPKLTFRWLVKNADAVSLQSRVLAAEQAVKCKCRNRKRSLLENEAAG